MTPGASAAVAGLPDGAAVQQLALGMPRVQSTHTTLVEAASDALLGLTCIVPPCGDWRQPALPWRFRLDRPAWVLLSVMPLKDAGLDPSWMPLPHGVVWRFIGSARFHGDLLYAKRCEAGEVDIPGHPGRSPHGFRARPHLVMLAAELPAAPPDGQDRVALLAEQHRIEAIELAAGALRATVQLKPALRLSAFGEDAGPQLLAPPTGEQCGVRTWCMEPFQTARSPLPSNRRARLVDRGPAHVHVTTDADPLSRLELIWQVRLEPHRLVLRHGLRNHSDILRRLAVWALVAGTEPLGMRSVLVQSPGTGSTAMHLRPMSLGPEGERGPIIEPLPQDLAGCHPLPDGLVVDGTVRAGAWQLKAGLRSPDGIAALALGRTALVSRVPAPAGEYPEGGFNLTTYHSDTVIEIEHVGPLVDLPPGGCTWLEQELGLRDLPEHGLDGLPGLAGRA